MAMHLLISMLVGVVLVDALPTVTFPINSQVPPVARVSTAFNFTFSVSTFTSTLPLTYTLSNAPTWLFLDGGSRTFSGTPAIGDANTAPVIEITATDSTGSVTMNATLVISGEPAPVIQVPLAKQLPNFGVYSAPSSIVMYPSTDFTFKFDANTFSSSATNHYAVTLDNTPLPSWIKFDGSSLTFTGHTPDSGSLVSPPQQFGILLIGSDVLGFAGVELPFYVVVGNHELAFSDSFVQVNTTSGSVITTSALRDTLTLDGVRISSSNLTSAVAEAPSWLTFDNSTFQLTGTVPANASSTNITISVSDIYGDSAHAIVMVDVTNSNTNRTVFGSTLGPINATIGSPFHYNLSSAFLNPSQVTVTVSESPSASWLSFDSSTLVLSGNVPSNSTIGAIEVTVNAFPRLSTRATTDSSSSQTFTINLQPASTTTTGATGGSSGGSSPSNTAGASSSGSGLTQGQLVAAILVPILAVILAISAFCLYCAGRRKNRERSRSPDKSDISNPISTSQVMDEKFIHPALRARNESGDADLDDMYMAPSSRNSAFARRSQTLHTILTNPLSVHLRDSDSRVRSFSEGWLGPSSGSWGSTEESSFPTMQSQIAASMLTRNFSRKSTGNVLGRDDVGHYSEYPLPLGESKYGGNVQYGKYRISKSSVQPTPDLAYGYSENVVSYRDSMGSRQKTPNYLGTPGSFGKRLSGLGHGMRRSAGSSSSISSERRHSRHRSIGVGHGFGGRPTSYAASSAAGVVRESNSWLTIQTGYTKGTRPASQMSALTESTDVLYNENNVPNSKSIRVVPKSPAPSSLLSGSSRLTQGTGNMYARPVSRRDPSGTSPFFAGSSSRASSAARSLRTNTSQRLRGYTENIYEDEPPAMPTAEYTNNSLEESIRAGLRETTIGQNPEPRDSFGISYGHASNATDHLRSFVASMSQRLSWRTPKPTPHFDDNASRFQSAETSQRNSPTVSHKRSPARHSVLTGPSPLKPSPSSISDSEFYDRASLASLRDSHGNIIQYEIDESPELGQAVARPSLSKPFLSFSSGSGGGRPSLIRKNTILVAAKERFHQEGPGRRPISVDVERADSVIKKQKSFTASHFEAEEVRRSFGGARDSFGTRESIDGPAFL